MLIVGMPVSFFFFFLEYNLLVYWNLSSVALPSKVVRERWDEEANTIGFSTLDTTSGTGWFNSMHNIVISFMLLL